MVDKKAVETPGLNPDPKPDANADLSPVPEGAVSTGLSSEPVRGEPAPDHGRMSGNEAKHIAEKVAEDNPPLSKRAPKPADKD